jgi:folate-binding protein YgfZ
MAETELIDKAAGLHREQYRGAETAAVYSNSGQEVGALIRSAGIYHLDWRVRLTLTGKDRVRWLNGMITNNVRDLAVGQGVYNFVLTPQGRIQGDLYAYNYGEHLVLDTDAFQAENLFTLLKRYIIMDKVEIARQNGGAGIGVVGPHSQELLKKVGIEVPGSNALQFVETVWRGLRMTITRGDLPQVESYQLWLEATDVLQLWQALVNHGGTPAGSKAVELLRIACGIPAYGQDIRERDLPQETGQERALSFTKGCYIGQEIVERIRARGAVHRKFTGLTIHGPLPAVGVKAQVDGKDIAEITSAAILPLAKGDLPVALGYVRREACPAGAEIELDGAKARVTEVPFAQMFASAGINHQEAV